VGQARKPCPPHGFFVSLDPGFAALLPKEGKVVSHAAHPVAHRQGFPERGHVTVRFKPKVILYPRAESIAIYRSG